MGPTKIPFTAFFCFFQEATKAPKPQVWTLPYPNLNYVCNQPLKTWVQNLSMRRLSVFVSASTVGPAYWES